MNHYFGRSNVEAASKLTVFGGSDFAEERINEVETLAKFDCLAERHVSRRCFSEKQAYQSRFQDRDVETAFWACINREFFLTSRDFFGLGPLIIQPGDVDVVLNGLQWPKILRPVPNRPGKYSWCGICYIHDVMDGSWVREKRAQGIKDETFVLV